MIAPLPKHRTVEFAGTTVPESLRCDHSLAARLGRWKQPLGARAAVPFSRLFGPRVQETFGILMYHRIARRTSGIPCPTWNVTPAKFRAQLAGLLKRGYRAWPLKEIIEVHQSGGTIPARTFVVTFDDGYANNFHHARPILQELGVPATIFLATAYLDSVEPFPCDDWSAAGSPDVPVESWQPLSTDQCRTMLDEGLIELGAHTHTHADFRNRPEAIKDDLLTCLGLLRDRFGIEAPTFAFPYGTKHLGFAGPPLSDAVRQTGVRCSLTTESETVSSTDDPFDWGRFTAEQSDTPATLAAKLDGWYTAARRLWRRRSIDRKTTDR